MMPSSLQSGVLPFVYSEVYLKSGVCLCLIEQWLGTCCTMTTFNDIEEDIRSKTPLFMKRGSSRTLAETSPVCQPIVIKICWWELPNLRMHSILEVTHYTTGIRGKRNKYEFIMFPAIDLVLLRGEIKRNNEILHDSGTLNPKPPTLNHATIWWQLNIHMVGNNYF